MTLKKIFKIVRLVPKVGLWNIGYVIWYRFSLKIGLRKLFFPILNFDTSKSGYYRKVDEVESYPESWRSGLLEQADEIISGNIKYFFNERRNIGTPPDWFYNPFNNTKLETPDKHWSELGDFDLNTGDIKILWEPSRFYWITTLARAYRVTGEEKYLKTINEWVDDWAINNPLNQGPNWKCGQETSVRLINLLTASYLLNQDTSGTQVLKRLILAHLKRIRPNIRYAIAQDNNHGTSEAAGLFIGGSWLNQFSEDPEIQKFAEKCYLNGRKWLEERIKYLIQTQGSFAQHSTNYHRVLIDTLTLVETWRNRLNLKKFSSDYYKRVDSAIFWLEQMYDSDSGQVPNLGANDGARIINLHSCDYTSFKPSIQTARSVFSGIDRFEIGPWDEPKYWLDIQVEECHHIIKRTQLLDDRYLIIKSNNSWGMLRLPKFYFRPKHNDVFHFDLWYKGVNILCDSGSYSYFNPEGKTFKSVKSHNTVSFGSYEQMPQVSKFLLSEWIELDEKDFDVDQINDSVWSGTYTDYRGNKHKRSIKKKANIWMIRDEVVKTNDLATLNWSLPIIKEGLSLQGNVLRSDSFRIEINGGKCISLDNTYQSKYYNEKHVGTRFSIVFTDTSIIETKIILK